MARLAGNRGPNGRRCECGLRIARKADGQFGQSIQQVDSFAPAILLFYKMAYLALALGVDSLAQSGSKGTIAVHFLNGHRRPAERLNRNQVPAIEKRDDCDSNYS